MWGGARRRRKDRVKGERGKGYFFLVVVVKSKTTAMYNTGEGGATAPLVLLLLLDAAPLTTAAHATLEEGDLVLVLGGHLQQQLLRVLEEVTAEVGALQAAPRHVVDLHADAVHQADIVRQRVAGERLRGGHLAERTDVPLEDLQEVGQRAGHHLLLVVERLLQLLGDAVHLPGELRPLHVGKQLIDEHLLLRLRLHVAVLDKVQRVRGGLGEKAGRVAQLQPRPLQVDHRLGLLLVLLLKVKAMKVLLLKGRRKRMREGLQLVAFFSEAARKLLYRRGEM